jgi:hypothetical protein
MVFLSEEVGRSVVVHDRERAGQDRTLVEVERRVSDPVAGKAVRPLHHAAP